MNLHHIGCAHGVALLTALLALTANVGAQQLTPSQRESAKTCPAAASPEVPWVAVVSKRQPISVRASVAGDYDPSSVPELMAERGFRATGKWIMGGLGLGGAIGVPMVGGVVSFASFVTSPFAFLAGAMEGGSQAAAHSDRHEALARQLEGALLAVELEAQLARTLADTLGEVASVPVLFVDGSRLTGGASLRECGAIVVLALEVERVGFEAPSLIEFTARPYLSVRYQLTEGRSASASLHGTARFAGRYHKFASVELDGPGVLASELVAGMKTLSDRIHAALPSTVAWIRPAGKQLTTTQVLTSRLTEDLRQPLRVHPDLIRPPSVRLAAIAAPD